MLFFPSASLPYRWKHSIHAAVLVREIFINCLHEASSVPAFFLFFVAGFHYSARKNTQFLTRKSSKGHQAKRRIEGKNLR
jgi:hypothetical protein